MSVPNIRSFEPIVPMIYAYCHPDYAPHLGWTKIGYTEKQTVEERVKQQHQQSQVNYKILWRDNAIYKDGSGIRFTDHEFHRYLEETVHVQRRPRTEWFQVEGQDARAYFDEFASRRPAEGEAELTYTLREEQETAVSMTADWFKGGGTQFLWNAKPRFGKTLTTYELIRRMSPTAPASPTPGRRTSTSSSVGSRISALSAIRILFGASLAFSRGMSSSPAPPPKARE